MSKDSDTGVSDNLEDEYRSQISEAMQKEAERRISEKIDPIENSRLLSLSLIELFESKDDSLVPALMARLGPVRAALEGHGGALVVSSAEIEVRGDGNRALSLVIDLDGACVSCGAAPGTLREFKTTYSTIMRYVPFALTLQCSNGSTRFNAISY